MELLIQLSSRRGGTVHVGRHQIAVLASVNAATVVVITAAGCKNIRYLISDICYLISDQSQPCVVSKRWLDSNRFSK